MSEGMGTTLINVITLPQPGLPFEQGSEVSGTEGSGGVPCTEGALAQTAHNDTKKGCQNALKFVLMLPSEMSNARGMW